MRWPASSFALIVAFVIHSDSRLRGADAPAPAAAKESGVTIGEMRIQTIPAKTYLYTTLQTSFPKMGDQAKEGFDKVFRVVVDNKLQFTAPTMMIYYGNPHFEPQKEFKVDLGVVVPDSTAAPDEATGVVLRKTDAFRCASVLYTGPVGRQGEAYQKLIPALKAAGHTPTGEEREMSLYWEGRESPHNVFLLMIGIK